MAYVGFKLGLQASIDALYASRGGTEGTFYLTSDTNRLYVGKTGGEISPVNEGVITVDSIGNLPSVDASNAALVAGQFYYVKNSNILCVYNGQKWVQINSDTHIESVSTDVSATNNKATVTTTFTDNNGDSTKKSTFGIEGNSLISVSGGTNGVIKLDGAKYSFSDENTVENNSATIVLENDKDNITSSYNITGGSNITLEDAANGNGIVINAKDTTAEKLEITNGESNGWKITVTDTNGATVQGALSPEIKYGANEDQPASFENNVAKLSVYTKAEVDEAIEKQIRQFNAMEYQGTINGDAAMPSSNVKNGYSYLLSENRVINGTSYPAGTLVIATGVEGDDGYLTNITWTFVTGSVADTTYTLAGFDKSTSDLGIGINLKDSHGSEVGSFAVKAGKDLVVSPSISEDKLSTTVTVAHKEITTESNAVTADSMNNQAASYAIPAITGLEIENGHIVGYITTTYSVKDTNATMKTVQYGVESVENGLAVKNTVTIAQSSGSESSVNGGFNLQSSSLAISGENAANGGANIGINLVWGTF